MIVSITNAVFSTHIIFIVFIVVLLFSMKRREVSDWLPTSVTNELKGAAILMVVFSHIGYFLVSDTQFLQPISTMAGIGVNVFLFFSGFGLTASQLKKDTNTLQFYKKRLLKLFTPFWLMLGVYTFTDFFFLHIRYTSEFFHGAVFGIITHSDLYQDFNSPLWYLTLTIGYYLLFPLMFSKKWPWASALLLYLAGYLFIFAKPHYFDYVLYLYKVHIIAFPLGVLVAWIVSKCEKLKTIPETLHSKNTLVHFLLLVVAMTAFVYATIHSEIGQSPELEEWMSIVGTLALIVIFALKKMEFRILTIFGLYSYEIYLWHWPLMYRYDFLYKYFPRSMPWLPTLLYLVVFIGIGFVSKKIFDGTLVQSIRTWLQSEI